MKSLKKTWLWRNGKRFAADPVRRNLARLCNFGRIPLTYFDIPNWGDALSPVLVEYLSGRKTQRLNGFFYDRYLVVGSILGSANSRAEVWGSGFIQGDETTIETPRAIHAVRGPLTRARLIESGVDCPEVYGDPALLLPRFYNPTVEPRYRVGIIPHFSDKGNPWVERYRAKHGLLILDIESGIRNFVRQVKSCEMILSSSLHGLICADAYRVPNAWIKLSDKLLGKSFKFRDYRLSIMAGEPTPIDISTNPTLETVLSAVELHDLRIDLRKLLLACPFLDPGLRDEVENGSPVSCGLPEFFRTHMAGDSHGLERLS